MYKWYSLACNAQLTVGNVLQPVFVHYIAKTIFLLRLVGPIAAGNDITDDFLAYALPLIQGEPTRVMENGVPKYLYRK